MEMAMYDPKDLHRQVGKEVRHLVVQSKELPHLYGNMMTSDASGAAPSSNMALLSSVSCRADFTSTVLCRQMLTPLWKCSCLGVHA